MSTKIYDAYLYKGTLPAGTGGCEAGGETVNEKDNRAIEPVALSTAGIRQGYSHYHKPCPYDFIDVYRVLEMFGVTDPCLQHAIKKLLVAGGRGQKDIRKDVAEAIVTLTRWQQMREEEEQHQ